MSAASDELGCAVRSPASRGPTRLPRLLPPAFSGETASLGAHLARHGGLPSGDRCDLIAEVGRAGLTGRGGGAYPTARKLAAVAAAAGSPVVIVNGTEGEPASAKDKVLMATEPHLVLDGAVAAARAVGASEVIVAANPAVADTINDAISERRALRSRSRGWPSRGSPTRGLDDVAISMVPAARGFVAGEATAVVNWIGGGPPVPTATPPRLAERGLHGRPTLVQNAETLGHVALIARYGARWFREVGTETEPGSMLVTIVGSVREPGVREIEIGAPVTEVLAQAGGPARPLRALLIGGYFGTWVPWAAAADLPFSAAGLAAVGAAPAAGLVAALPASACGLAETARVARYLAAESAGQCGPCVFGLDAIAGELASLATGRSFSLTRLRRWLSQADRRGACHHPDGAVSFIRSALVVFESELELHASGWCSGTDDETVLPVPLRRAS